MQINSGQRRSERGNILFLILLAVVLFAALSNAVTQAIRGGGKDGSSEGAALRASQLVTIATNFENNLRRFMLVNNYIVENIDWNGTNLAGPNLPGCGSTSCHFFHKDGGGMTIPSLDPLKFSDPVHTSRYPTHASNGAILWNIYKQKVKDVGTDLPDIFLSINGVQLSICEEVNRAFNTASASSTGTLRAINEADSVFSGDTPIDVPGKSQTWCLAQSGPHGSYFYHVLIAR